MEIALVLIILAIAVILFATERLAIDMVALTVLGVLLLSPLVTVEEALSGLSNPATVTVGAMFVLSAGLYKTGALLSVGRALTRLGKHKIAFLAVTMVISGVTSAFINNTPVVAVMLPLMMGIAAKHEVPPSRWLIPLSYASQFGGVCTLIGTSTNLLVSSISERAGFGSFSMFEFTRLGLIMFAAGIVYFLLVGRFLLPERRSGQVTDAYQLRGYITELRLVEGSPLIGKTLKTAKWFAEHDVRVIKLIRRGRAMSAWSNRKLLKGDVLLVEGDVNELLNLKEASKLEINPKFELKDSVFSDKDITLAEALIAPRSRLIGRTLSEVYFRRRYRLMVLAIARIGRTLREKLDKVRLQKGDALLVEGTPKEIERLVRDEDFIVLGELKTAHFVRSRAPVAIGIIAGVVLVATLTPIPIVATAVAGAVLMILTGCLKIEDAYEAIDWKVIFLLAGILPLGIAMTNTGAAGLIAKRSLHLVGGFGPVAILAVLYLLAAALTETMSNNAAAVLLSPIAISTALELGADPKPFLLAITFAASTSFATPVGYQTNALIYHPGGYRYTDFMKVGIPLNLIFWALAVIFIPRFWPF